MNKKITNMLFGQIVVLNLCLFTGQSLLAKTAVRQFPDRPIQRIAFGSCAKQWHAQPIWEAIVAAEPDLWLFLGDAIYADTDGKTAWKVTEGQLVGEWNRLADKPEFQKAWEKIPMLATWDNHDYGTHAGGVEFELKEESKEIFLDFFDEPVDSERRLSQGIYDAKMIGPEGKRVQVILLDTRFFKDRYKKNPVSKEEWIKAGKVGGYIPDHDSSKTLLGEEQWDWLEKQLRKSAEVRLIASSIQIIPNEKGMDEWANFPRERQRLFDLINKTKAQGVVFLSGNVHFAEISKTDEAQYILHELTSSGMTHINELYGNASNRYRSAGPYIDLNFGLVEVQWDTKPGPKVVLQIHDIGGTVVYSNTIDLDSLK
jgi:alkaline phosphatase D